MLLEQFLKTRAWTEALVEPLETEDFVVQPVVDVSPPKWHLAHTTWFFENFVLKPYLPKYTEFDPEFGFLFNSYYNHVGKRSQRDERGFLSRPTVKTVMQYRQHVSEAVALFWEELDKHSHKPEIMRRVEIGINHEQQHQELLLSDIKYILGHQYLMPAYVTQDAPDLGWMAEKKLEWNTIPEGLYTIGHEGGGFAFDNEKDPHQVYTNSYEMADRAITNEEYLEFIEIGGYKDFRYWLAEGWDWVQKQEAEAPMYWHFSGNRWKYYTLGGLKEIEEASPIMHVNYYEADAFARWKGARLPTEAEWEIAFQFNPDWMHSPVWEWCASAYLPYPGFKIEEGALGEYNGKFMSGQMVLRGASLATPDGHWRPSYRNFFHPHLQWQFSGIRLVR